ncbi:MAG: leucyl aminopeptidase [Nitrospiraceae bacterium]|nr:MAG: leucyl aminopeptidase [Nitrospiraceae bacterium]
MLTIKVFLKDKSELSFPCDVLVLPVLEAEGVKAYRDIDKAMKGLPGSVIASGEITGKHKEVCLLHREGRITPRRILLVGLGKRSELSREKVRQAGGTALSALRNGRAGDIALSSRLFPALKISPADFLEGLLLGSYRFEKYRKENDRKRIRRITILSSQKISREVKRAEAATRAAWLARDLVNTPSNEMTPSALAAAARSLKNVTVRVINRKEAEKLGMGAYLSVAKGSTEPPKFIVITYKKTKGAPVVLIGKSITFDSGGISLKPSEGMEKMKYDMAGGAAVLGVMQALSELGLPLHIVAVLPATENLPGGSASKPGDVVKTIEGKSIEIISTDAEGRMALADAIGYAKRFKPSAIIDIATLTGACSIALGNEAVAMMGNDAALMKKLERASEETGEKVWTMPLFDEYGEYIKSDIADLKNSGGRSGSLVTAGYFLKECAGRVPWVHLDIAGAAWTDKDRPYAPKGGTGIGTRLLLSFLMNRDLPRA